jgi:hypothetical protein
MKYLVFAGNYRQFKWWEEKYNTPRAGEAVYVADRSNLRNWGKKQLTMVKVGTFHLRPDAKDIMNEAKVRFPNAQWQEYSIS